MVSFLGVILRQISCMPIVQLKEKNVSSTMMKNMIDRVSKLLKYSTYDTLKVFITN